MNTIDRLVIDEINSRVALATTLRMDRRYTDSVYSMNPRLRKNVMRLADKAIACYDTMYNDFIGFAIFKSVFLSLILPLLLDMVKGSIAGGITASVKQRVIDPLLNKLIGYGRDLTRSSNPDDPIVKKICDNIKLDLGKVIDALKANGSWIAGKLAGLFGKIKGLSTN